MRSTEGTMITNWARIPAEHDHGFGSRTHGVAILQDGRIAVLAQADPAIHLFDEEGRLTDSWGSDLHGAHGLTHVVEDGSEHLWITDQTSGHVGRYDLYGHLLQTIEPPADEHPYSPTQVAVAPNTRDVWVADGYGSNVIRRYDRFGRFIRSHTGKEAPGRFARPHGITFASDGTLYVADRGNRRMIAYDEDGNYRFHRDGIAHSPCGFAIDDDHLYVPELFGGIKVLDRSLMLVEEIGTNVVERPVGGWEGQADWGWPLLASWPDQLGSEGATHAWIAPHDVAVARDGSLYVVEWVAGGRITCIPGRPSAASFRSSESVNLPQSPGRQ